MNAPDARTTPPGAPGVIPLLVRSIAAGTGGSFLVRLLASSPNVATTDSVGLGPRDLALIAAFVHSNDPARSVTQAQRGRGRLVDSTLAFDAVALHAGLARRSLTRLFSTVADRQPDARWYVEQTCGSMVEPALAAAGIPSFVIVLERDPRDAFASLVVSGAVQSTIADATTFIAAVQSEGAAVERPADELALVIQFEDLVLRPHQVVTALHDHLGIVTDPRVIRRHSGGSSASRDGLNQTIGLWRTVLGPDVSSLLASPRGHEAGAA